MRGGGALVGARAMDRALVLWSNSACKTGMEVAVQVRFLVVALIATGGLLSGCAFGDRQADMAYPPAPEHSSMAAVAAPATTPRGAVSVGVFEDIRLDKTVVGNVRNGFQSSAEFWGQYT